MWMTKESLRGAMKYAAARRLAVGFEDWTELVLVLGLMLAVLIGGWLAGCAYGGGVCLPGAACVPGGAGGINAVPTTTGCEVQGDVDRFGTYLHEATGCGQQLWVTAGPQYVQAKDAPVWYLPTGGDYTKVATSKQEFRQYIVIWDGYPDTVGSHVVGEGMMLIPAADERIQ